MHHLTVVLMPMLNGLGAENQNLGLGLGRAATGLYVTASPPLVFYPQVASATPAIHQQAAVIVAVYGSSFPGYPVVP